MHFATKTDVHGAPMSIVPWSPLLIVMKNRVMAYLCYKQTNFINVFSNCQRTITWVADIVLHVSFFAE